MKRLNAAERRYLQNARLIGAMRLVFDTLMRAGTPTQTIAEVADTATGGTPSRSVPDYFGGSVPWIKSGELNDGVVARSEEFLTQPGLENSSAKVFPQGTLLIALYGATVGKTGILGLDAATNQAVCAVIPKDANVSRDYLFFFLRYKRQDFIDSSFGGAQPNISQQVLRATLLPVPGIHVQREICRFLVAVEQRQLGKAVPLPSLRNPVHGVPSIVAKIERLAAKIEEGRCLKLASIQEGEILPASARNHVFSSLARKLEPVTLEAIAETRLGKMLSGNQAVDGGGVPYVRNANIQWDRLDLTDVYRMVVSEEDRRTLALEPGDILVCEGGDIGKSAIWNGEIAGCIYQKALHRVRVVQFSAFVLRMEPGDLVVTPRKHKAVIAVGEIAGPYEYDASAKAPYWHYRRVKWINTDVPRLDLPQDLRHAFMAQQTICQIKKNQAEDRLRGIIKAGFKPSAGTLPPPPDPDDDIPPDGTADLEQVARDQIAQVIIAKFKGHGMARLVNAVLVAQGYTTYVSPAGPGKGVDILAAPGPLGFGRPRLCVQVKSTDGPVDSPTLSQLIGTMQNVQADQGLLVSWGGFKNSIYQQGAVQFFRVRLWDQEALIAELLAHYDKLDPDVRAELPLKRIWALAAQEESE